MSEMKKLVLGETTEAVLRLLFDRRVAEESSDPEFNTANRALRIHNLKTQIIGFVKRNPNGRFILIVPEYKSEKVLKVVFDNFTIEDNAEDEKVNDYEIVLKDNFVEAEIIHKVIVGKDITLKIKAE